MLMFRVAVLLLAFGASTPALAWAQRFPFERTFAATETTKLDVSTLRGALEIVGADVDRREDAEQRPSSSTVRLADRGRCRPDPAASPCR